MFRPLRRTKNAISDEAAMTLLENEKRAVLAVNGEDGYPFAFPIDYFYDREEGKIFFHGSRSGLKVDCLSKDDRVCLTVYGDETFREGEWAPYLKSVVVYGRCRMTDDMDEKKTRMLTLAEKYYPSREEAEKEFAKDGRAARLYEIRIEHLTGKQIQER